MAAAWGCNPSPRLLKALSIAACVLLVIFGIFVSTTSLWPTGPHSIPSLSNTEPKPKPPPSKYAFATIITGEDNDETDLATPYFTAARILAYQLLHSPSTRGAGNIPVLVLVTENIPQGQRDALTSDGAIVIPVEKIASEWIHPKWERWSDVLAKLNIWKQTDYEKIAFIDADTVLFRPLDDIFTHPATTIRTTNSPLTPPRSIPGEDVGSEETNLPPSTYMISGIHDLWVEANLPPAEEWDFYVRNNYMNAGFFVTSPSEDMFQYYIKILQTPDQFDPAYPEQNLLNFVHRTDGRMPWQDIGSGWNQKGANGRDYERGLKSVHQKWWVKMGDSILDELIANATDEFNAFAASHGPNSKGR